MLVVSFVPSGVDLSASDTNTRAGFHKIVGLFGLTNFVTKSKICSLYAQSATWLDVEHNSIPGPDSRDYVKL
jgi:hypothetical protein